MSQDLEVAPARIDVHLLRCPLAVPVRSSFGAMTSRPTLLVRVEDADGAFGWGEIWCNFPTFGPEHRARMAAEAAGPVLLRQGRGHPAALFARMTEGLHVIGLQAGEPGPVAQVVAGLDQALWDLLARRRGIPLHRLLGGQRTSVPAYASGIDPSVATDVIAAARERGFSRFKVKVGFGREADLQAMRAVHDALRPGERFMLDANQKWTLAEAESITAAMAELQPLWLEEPLAADRPWAEWRRLAEEGVPLAAGENLRGEAAFTGAIGSGALRYIQPDLAKWGGLTVCLPLGRNILEAGLVYCPHYLGGAVGLLHSAHLLATVGGSGLLEIDAQDNPLRSELCGPILPMGDGSAALPDGPGLGAVPDPDQLARFGVWQATVRPD